MHSGPAPESVVRFAVELDRRVRSLVGDQLVSTILHGSSALGGFIAGRSDVDVLMLVGPPDLSPQRLERLTLAADELLDKVQSVLAEYLRATRLRPPPP